MTSKQEKLAAARRKLKEFQGKNKEVEFLKQKKISDPLPPQISNESSHDFAVYSDHDGDVQKIISQSPNNHIKTDYINQLMFDKKANGNLKKEKTSELSLNGSNASKPWLESIHANDSLHFPKEKLDFTNRIRPDFVESYSPQGKGNFETISNVSSADGVIVTEKNNILPQSLSTKLEPSEKKEYLNIDANNKVLKDIIEPLQVELQNHAQTITILVQQRNDAQTALTEAQALLNQKIGEIVNLEQQLTHLTTSTNSLSQRLSDAEGVIMKLKLEKEDNMLKQDEMMSLSDEFQVKLAEKEEQLQEVRRKHEEKNSECQKLLLSLQEAQSQLSLYQIQLQQYSAEGHSGLAMQISKLQSENLSLKQKNLELESKLEVESAEKEESSQKFHVYAQQCNSQLSLLNSQLKSLQLENENLSQRNNILSENMSELESGKDKPFSSESFETEIANLHCQLSALSEANTQMKNTLKQKEEEWMKMENKLKVKELELDQLTKKLIELEDENRKLEREAEMPKANERLLAIMESDKIAAAKAVSQNQKLKEQVIELEKAFMKLSEEKLELTNQLAHEKHVNAKLRAVIENGESKHADHHKHDCNHEIEVPERLVNDSNEMEELRNIIRQLQDDKVELTARLNFYESKKDNRDMQMKNWEENHDHEETQCENTKLLLQQMEAKVRKTMNEIAILDEEKEKLEHLVLQLQGETETIGEYITLYQKQRMLLKQRAQEKDIQLLQLSKDKEELKTKLVALDELVQRLVAERENPNIQPSFKLPEVGLPVETPENTAGQIRALINEIGSTTLINNQTIVFEHCSCCSGRLITI